MIQGRNLIVSIDGTSIAGAKSCQFQISQNFISACSPTEGRTKRKIPTDYDWSMSADCLIPSSSLSISLVEKLIAGTRVFLTFTDGSLQKRAGWAYVKSCDESGSVGSLAKFSASFEADGALYKYRKIEPSAFTEGMGRFISFSNNNEIVINEAPGDNIKRAVINIAGNEKLYIAWNAVNGFISIDSLENINGYISDKDGQDLDIYAVYKWKYTEDSMLITLPSGIYKVLLNADDDCQMFILTGIS